jgi:hypothetical protein
VGIEEFRQASLGYTQTGMYQADGTPIWGVPKNKYMKLQLAKFSAKETHKGLGTGVNEWINRFVRQLERAQVASGFCWHEDVKMDKGMMQKAVNKHEGRLHKGASMTKLAKGGGIETKGKTKGKMIVMKNGGKC